MNLSNELAILLFTAFSLGAVHTLAGPDHYVPFIALSKARNWSYIKTMWITLVCGIGHILSSVVLGLAGVALGLAVTKLEFIESTRGEMAAWLLIAFGFLYFAWGLKLAWKNKPHTHIHLHGDEGQHVHEHSHQSAHAHVHGNEANITPWVLFIIFVFGPCEPLIPLLMYPAAQNSMAGLILTTAVFGLTTITAMLAVVTVSYFGLSLFPMRKFERYTHAMAGGSILLCGLAIQFLGL